ncbi:MAG: PorV/PorQ family protein, partial [Tannerella sp.]|nr:PorV/PorQ family protein [Tannerella sp.]
MKYIQLVVLTACLPTFLFAQDGSDAYAFLRFPASSRINALGGHSVSLVEKDPSTVFHNPALLGGEMSGMLNINYMNYISDVNVGSAVFTKSFRERSSFGVGVSYINYGSMKETTADDVYLGEFSFQDIGFNVFYEYDLAEKWRGGLTFKALYSSLADYYSFG